MSSDSVCNHTRHKQIGLPLRGRPILLSLVWLQTELESTQSYYHYLEKSIKSLLFNFYNFNGSPVVAYFANIVQFKQDGIIVRQLC